MFGVLLDLLGLPLLGLFVKLLKLLPLIDVGIGFYFDCYRVKSSCLDDIFVI